MALQAIAFWVLAIVTIGSGLAVISARNPVHSVLFLIATFFSAAGLFVLLGAEFLAMLLVVVYVGAVAVLFLFVVMMLDVDFSELRAGFVRYLPIALVIGVVIVAELVTVSFAVGNKVTAGGAAPLPALGGVTNAEAIGQVLYTQYVYFFQVAGLVLLVAMIGAIVLTLRHRANVRRQDILAQVARTPATGMRIVQIRSGEGLSE
jgi:NADH-quinone oxidoreductase subunit J